MIETQMNMFDVIVIAVVGFSCLFAFFRGLVREVLSLVAWVGAAIITLQYFPQAQNWIAPHFTDKKVAAIAAGLGLFLLSLMAFGIINSLIIRTIRASDGAGMLDNLLGLAFGFFRGALIVSLAYYFIITFAIFDKDKEPAWLAQAKTRPYAAKGAQLLVDVAPEYMKRLSYLTETTAEEVREREPVTAERLKRNAQGLKRDTERNLDEINDRIRSEY